MNLDRKLIARICSIIWVLCIGHHVNKSPFTLLYVLKFGPSRNDRQTYQKSIPFSAGRRNCIGSGFAMQEMKIMLLRICSRLKIKNEVIAKDVDVDRPFMKQNFLWKLKQNSLNQRFTYRT